MSGNGLCPLRRVLLSSVSRLAIERALAGHAFAAACDVAAAAERNNSPTTKEKAPGAHIPAGPRKASNHVSDTRSCADPQA